MDARKLQEESKKVFAQEVKQELETLNKIYVLFESLEHGAKQRAYDWLGARFYVRQKQ